MAGAPLVDARRWLIFSLLDGPGAQILRFVLQSGTNYSPIAPVQFDQYLISLTGSSTANYLKLNSKEKKKTFNPDELKQIQKYPLWDNFDLCLLHKAIRLACDNIAKLDDNVKWKDPRELESLITKIKDERNSILREKEHLTEPAFLAKVRELEDIFEDCLKKAKIRCNVPDNVFTPVRDKVFKDISSIKTLTARQVLDQLSVDSLPLFEKEIKKYLEDCYQQARYFNPLSFLSGSHQNVDIQSIFCKAVLVSKTDKIEKDIDSLKILSLTKSMVQSSQPSTFSLVTQNTLSNRPHLFMICGQAGSGKTTLANYMVSERMKDAQNCGVEHLSDYDIVLRIVCREDDGPSLQDFLRRALPHIFFGIQDRLVALLKEYKVLFVIDGLDELSPGSSSDQLVTNILNESKNVPHFTVICTTRFETWNDFFNAVPDSYHKWKLEMKGISVDQRTNFVLKYYDSFPARSSKERDGLINLMQNIGWRDYLELPLNLMFLATLYYENPALVKNNETQTSLYVNIHEWCLQRLKGRLEVHPRLGRSSMACENSIRKILKSMYQVALRNLLNDRLSLSEGDTEHLMKCCKAENLPPEEVMGAYLCLREDVVMQVLRQKYSAPHKSVQEFWAAKAVVENLNKGLSTETIRHMLQEPSKQQFKKYRNILLHLAGLLSRPDVSPMPRAIEEVVDMLQESGMEHCNDWLSLLQDSEVNSDVLRRVAHYITTKSGDETVDINDCTVTSAVSLLPLIPHKEVRIELHRKETSTAELWLGITNHSCTKLDLYYHYKHPTITPASDTLLDALPRNHLEEFIGHLSADGIRSLPECLQLRNLHLAAWGDHDAPTILSTLAEITPLLPRLSFLMVHVKIQSVTAEILTPPLPDVRDVDDANPGFSLVLSGMNEHLLEKTSRIASALQPRMGEYRDIRLPGCIRMDVSQWKSLLNLLADAQVRVRCGVLVPKHMLEEEEYRELDRHAKTMGLYGIFRRREDMLWQYRLKEELALTSC